MNGGRIFARHQGGRRRFYADFRDYADVGGRQEALIPPNTKRATTDEAEAEALCAKRLEFYQQRRLGALHDVIPVVGLATAVRDHLVAKAKAAKVTDEQLVADEHYLARAVEQFGADRPLGGIDTGAVRQWIEWLRTLPNGRGGNLDDATVRHHVNALSNLFKRARAEAWAPKGHDPVGDLVEKPVGNADEPLWLEVPEAALYLEAARTCPPAEPAANGQRPIPFGYELVATFLLTGGRQDEVLGLEVSDIDFERKTITFRPNGWRRLKTATSHRTVPLWPQLAQILRPYLRHRIGGLVFPSDRTGQEAMLTDVRKLLDRVTARAGTLYVVDRGQRRKAEAEEIRTKVFRHTYITARLQTLDRGQPVSVWTVAREVGHRSTDMVERVYGHLGQLRHRARAVEYKIKQHRKALGERAAALQIVA